jgi:hypothetical protein
LGIGTDRANLFQQWHEASGQRRIRADHEHVEIVAVKELIRAEPRFWQPE